MADRRASRRRGLLAGVTALGAAVALGAPVALSAIVTVSASPAASEPTEALAAAAARPPAPAGAQVRSSDLPEISAKTARSLSSDGVSIEPLGAKATELAVLPQAKAVRAAVAAFPGWIDESKLVEGSLSSVTFENNGREQEPDPSKPSRIQLAVDHRPAWVLRFTGVPVPLLGAYNPEDPEAPPPEAAPSDLIVFIDARSGEFINAQTP